MSISKVNTISTTSIKNVSGISISNINKISNVNIYSSISNGLLIDANNFLEINNSGDVLLIGE